MRADSCKGSSPRCPRAAAGGLALAALITLAFAGAAAAAPAEAEDARCVSDCDCPAGELCRPPAGTCEPAVCPRIFRPVCGLDGKTYGNECEANAAHVVVAYEGECGAVCGGITGKRCPEGQVCDLPAGMYRGADLQGVCKQRPNVCPLIFDPVCGCDGKTYANDCDRLAAAVQKDHDGPCEMAATEKSCQRNADCARDQYCAFPTCRMPAHRCDLDHIQPFNHHTPHSGGQTTPDNLQPLCRRHHRLKTHDPGWRVTRNPHTGTTTWTSPTGHTYTNSPPVYLE